MDNELENFNKKILDITTFEKIPISNIVCDDVIKTLFESANPIAGIRTTSEYHEQGAQLYNLLALQSPIICYRFRKSFKALTGTFTLAKLLNAQATFLLEEDSVVPCIIIDRKPSESVRRSIALFALTNDLISKSFINETRKIIFYLRAWFPVDDGRNSLFKSNEWLTLFPHIDTAEKLANHLSISKADLFRR